MAPAQSRHRLDVGLHPGFSCTVRARDGQYGLIALCYHFGCKETLFFRDDEIMFAFRQIKRAFV